jgi:Putative beta barrel porin-7 (BBP7)
MRKGFLGSLLVLSLGSGLAQAQWGPYPPQYAPYPPQYQPYYGQMGYPSYGTPMPYYPGNPYGAPQPATAAPPMAAPSVGEPPRLEAAPESPACGPGCTQPGWSTPPGPELDHYVSNVDHGPCLRFWISTEYLYWWTKATPTPVPLVTTGSPNAAVVGVIGEPRTSVLFGGGDINLPAGSGFRLTLGGWLDHDNKFGLEVSGFLIENQVVNYSNSNSPVLAVPINVTGNGVLYPNGNSAVPINSPVIGQGNPLNLGSTNAGFAPQSGPYTGNINVSVASQLWGVELNGYYNLFRCSGWNSRSGWFLDVLGGFRYLNLTESLTLNANNLDSFGLANSYNDSFQATNQFFGGQVGLKAGVNYCGWSLVGTLKAAFGANQQTLTVNGSTTQSALPGSAAAGLGIPTQTFQGGILTQPSNIGTTRQTDFSVVPSANIKIGYDLSPNVRLFAGYDIIYWTNTLRATNQLDGSVNPSQAGGGMLSGAANPAPMFNRSNYFAQGVSAGIMFSY